jgi:hypothetical protein
MTRFAQLVALGLLLGSGCATTSAPQQKKTERVPEEAPTRRRLKLAVLPVESDNYPRLAKGINSVFHEIQVPGVDDYFLSRVTLEVAQLAIECVDVTNECWMAVGKSLTSDRLLLAQIVRPAKKKDRSVQMSVTYFDVGTGQPLHVANRNFKNEDEALRGMKDLIDNAISQTAAATASTETK